MTKKRLLDSPNHRSARILLLALAAWAMLAIAIPSIAFAQSDGKITRTIELEVVPGSPFIIQGGDGEFAGMGAPPPSAMVSLHSFGGDALVEFKFKAMPIIQQLENGAYSLYFTTRASSAEYVSGEPGSDRIKFNTDFNGTVNLWGIAFGVQNIDAPRITAFIAYDPDDGRAFNPNFDLGRVIFEGTSLR